MSYVTQQQQQEFEDQGFYVVRSFFSPAEVQRVCDELSAVVAQYPDLPEEFIQLEPAVAKGEYKPESLELGVRKLFRMVKHSAVFREVALHPRFVETAEFFLGEHVKLFQSMMLIKPPQVGMPKIWHQDNAYFRIEPCNIVGFWVALDEATVENGCMHVIPGTHKKGLVPHVQTIDLGLPEEEIDPEQVVPLPMAAGDALVFSSHLYHYTPDNKSNHRRRALQYHYADARCRYIDRGKPDGRFIPPELIVSGRSFREGI